MDSALIIGAAVMGLAGAPHCAAMCGAPCLPLTRGATPWAALPFHVGRIASYAMAGGLAAGSVGLLARLAQWSPALRPLWLLLHLAALGLGLWLLWRGRQPAWLETLGQGGARSSAAHGGWQPIAGPAGPAGLVGPSGVAASAGRIAAGLAWVAWPCGLLQSALLTASLTNGPWAGAGAMAAFAATSAGGLLAAPVLLAWLGQRPQAQRWAVRLAGLLLAGASLWAVAHDLIVRFVAWCVS